MKSYKDLKVWQKSMDLAVHIYEITGNFPAVERYGLTVQIRKAALSVPSNIAEGYGRRSPKQRVMFLEYALGSIFEVETQAEFARRIHFLTDEQSVTIADQVRGIGRGLSALIEYVEREAAEMKAKLPKTAEELRGTPRNPRD